MGDIFCHIIDLKLFKVCVLQVFFLFRLPKADKLMYVPISFLINFVRIWFFFQKTPCAIIVNSKPSFIWFLTFQMMEGKFLFHKASSFWSLLQVYNHGKMLPIWIFVVGTWIAERPFAIRYFSHVGKNQIKLRPECIDTIWREYFKT